MAEGMPIANARQAFEEALTSSPALQKSDSIWKVLSSRWISSVLGALVIMLLLWVINPPMVQSKQESDIHHLRRSPQKILLWGALSWVLILVIPFLLQFWAKKHGSSRSG